MKRYIDADLARAQFTGNFQASYSPSEAKVMIDEVPTADVEPIRHAHWIIHDKTLAVSFGEFAVVGHYFECSSCGRTEDHKEPYCNCGAKMDEESN